MKLYMVQAAVCAYHDSTLRSAHVLAALGRGRYVGDDAAVERICAAGARALPSCQYMPTERMRRSRGQPHLETPQDEQGRVRGLGGQADICRDVDDEGNQIRRPAACNVSEVAVKGRREALENQKGSHRQVHQRWRHVERAGQTRDAGEVRVCGQGREEAAQPGHEDNKVLLSRRVYRVQSVEVCRGGLSRAAIIRGAALVWRRRHLLLGSAHRHCVTGIDVHKVNLPRGRIL